MEADQSATEESAVAAAIRELAHQVDTLGNAVYSAGAEIAKAIRDTNTGSTGVRKSGTFT
jgi:outer membrane murein-binding lipoprotein Lpp